jgi:hypothetical protein
VKVRTSGLSSTGPPTWVSGWMSTAVSMCWGCGWATVVLACRGLVALSCPRRRARADRKHRQTVLLEAFDEQTLAAFDRHSHQARQTGQRADQVVNAFTVMREPAVPDLPSVRVDHRDLVMGATPIDAGKTCDMSFSFEVDSPAPTTTTVTRYGAQGATPVRSSRPVTDERNRSASGPRRSVCTGSLPSMRMTRETIPGPTTVN